MTSIDGSMVITLDTIAEAMDDTRPLASFWPADFYELLADYSIGLAKESDVLDYARENLIGKRVSDIEGS